MKAKLNVRILAGMVTVMAAAAVMAASGEASTSLAEDTGYMDIVDEHAEIYLALDEDGVLFDSAVQEVGGYLSGKTSWKETIETVETVMSDLNQRAETVEDYTLSEELSELMWEYGISIAEFEAFGNSRSEQLAEYLLDLESLAENLQYAEEFESDYEKVEFWYDIQLKMREANRGYYYYGGINLWFAEWEDEQVEYVREQVIDQIQYLIPEDAGWETSQEAAEEKANQYVDIFGKVSYLYAELYGEEWEELQALEAETE